MERIAGPNIVCVQENVESAGCEEIVELQRSCSGFNASIADKYPSLSAEQANAFQHRRCEFGHRWIVSAPR
ncbi:hypothetical protein WP12_16320 [Sphingomonas sp. SRS2]|nr:hypothetical protein WP12_16320 [Sphingomonas sp. SRS2]